MLDAGWVWYLWNHSKIDRPCIPLAIQVLHPIVILMPYTEGMLLPSASSMLAIRKGDVGLVEEIDEPVPQLISRNKDSQPSSVQHFLAFLLELHG